VAKDAACGFFWSGPLVHSRVIGLEVMRYAIRDQDDSWAVVLETAMPEEWETAFTFDR
jgi:hypothetical protein